MSAKEIQNRTIEENLVPEQPAILVENIPQYMKDRPHPQWVLWRYEQSSGRKKPTKVPYQVDGKRAKSNDQSSWSDFDSILRAYKTGGFDGIGFVFAEGDELFGIDLDQCFNDNGELEPWAASIIERFQVTYMELLPSDLGIHIIGVGKHVQCGQKK